MFFFRTQKSSPQFHHLSFLSPSQDQVPLWGESMHWPHKTSKLLPELGGCWWLVDWPQVDRKPLQTHSKRCVYVSFLPGCFEHLLLPVFFYGGPLAGIGFRTSFPSFLALKCHILITRGPSKCDPTLKRKACPKVGGTSSEPTYLVLVNLVLTQGPSMFSAQNTCS